MFRFQCFTCGNTSIGVDYCRACQTERRRGKAERAEAALMDRDDPWVVVGTTAVDGTLDALAEAFNVPACAVGASVHGLIEGGHVVDVRGRHLRPMEWVPPQDGAATVVCDVVRRQSEVTASWHAAGEAIGRAYAKAHPQKACPECGPHGNAGRVLLLESWVDCTTCRPRPAHLVVDGGDGQSLTIDLEKDAIEVPRGKVSVKIKTVDKASDKLRAAGFAYPTAADVRLSLPTPVESREYLGHALKTFTPPTMSEVAQEGVRAFMEALAPLQFNDNNIGKAMRMMDEHIDKCQTRLRELGLVVESREHHPESLHDKCIWNGAESCQVFVDGRTVTMNVKMRQGMTIEEMEERVRWALPISDGMTYVFREVG